MKLATLMMLLVGAAPMAGAAETLPPVADVVAHARAVMDKKPQEVVCKVVVDTQLLDKTGKPEHDEHREGKATLARRRSGRRDRRRSCATARR